MYTGPTSESNILTDIGCIKPDREVIRYRRSCSPWGVDTENKNGVRVRLRLPTGSSRRLETVRIIESRRGSTEEHRRANFD